MYVYVYIYISHTVIVTGRTLFGAKTDVDKTCVWPRLSGCSCWEPLWEVPKAVRTREVRACIVFGCPTGDGIRLWMKNENGFPHHPFFSKIFEFSTGRHETVEEFFCIFLRFSTRYTGVDFSTLRPTHSFLVSRNRSGFSDCVRSTLCKYRNRGSVKFLRTWHYNNIKTPIRQVPHGG